MAIDLKQAIQTIKEGSWLSLRFITADLTKGSGGQVLEFPRARLAKNRSTDPKPPQHEIDERRNGMVKRNPQHHLHFTLNLELPNHQIRKVHPILITHVNNIKVL